MTAPPDTTLTSDPVLAAVLGELAATDCNEAAARAALLRPGHRLGRFELVRELGRGGFGLVFEARDAALPRNVALKIVRPERAAVACAALRDREASAAARLQHPNIVTLLDIGAADGLPYLVLELLDGETLGERLRRGPLPLLEAVDVAADVARGLQHAHAAGIIHRDLKPANVFLQRGGAAKILDFGLARPVGATGLPAGGGTPGFMAPEQWSGAHEDERTDVFAAGVLLHAMISGVLPGAAKLRPAPAPCGLDALIAAALAARREERPRDGADLLSRLLNVRAAVERRAARRRRWKRAAAAAFAAVAAAAMLAPPAAAGMARRTLARQRLALLRAAQEHPDPAESARLLASLGPDDEPPGAAAVALRLLRLALPVHVEQRASVLAAAPDGASVAADSDGAAWLREPGGAATRLTSGPFPASDAAFSTDGKRVALADYGGTAWLFDRRGARLAILRGHEPWSAVRSVRFSRDGSLVVTAGDDGSVRVFDAAGARLDVLRFRRPLMGAELDAGAAYVAALGRDGVVAVHRLGGGEVAVLRGHTAPVIAAAFDAGGGWLTTVAADGTAIAWDRDGSADRMALGVPRGGLERARFVPDGALIAGCSDGTQRTFRVDREQREPSALRGHRGPVRQLGFAAGGARLVSAGADGTARVWNLQRRSATTLDAGPAAVNAAAVSAGGALAATASDDGTVRVFDLGGAGRPRLAERRSWSTPLTAIAFADEGGAIAVGDREGGLHLFEAGVPGALAVRAGDAAVTSIEFAGASTLAVTTADGRMRMIARDSAALTAGPASSAPPAGRPAALDDAPVTASAISADGSLAATAGADGAIHVSTVSWRGLWARLDGAGFTQRAPRR